nr:berberine bridge enzyme-like 22 [Ipomoea batatas]
MNYYHCMTVVLCLSIIRSCDAGEGGFAECMSVKNSLSRLHSPSSSSYSSLLQSAQQNPRWLNSTSAPRPQFIVTPTTLAEIQAAVVCSRKHGMQVRVKSGGHDYEGLSYLCYHSPFIVIDLDDFRTVRVDLEGETAWVQSGATLGELYYTIAKESGGSLGFSAGLYPSVGVGGHFSGGGIGTMMRKHGLAADNVVDAQLVDVNGRILDRKTMGEDLFWAIRGGGGASFGVIAAWKVRLVRVPPLVTVFSITLTPEQGIKLVHRWQFIAPKLPKDLFIRTLIQKLDGGERPIEVVFESLFLKRKKELIPLMNQRFPELKLRVEDCTELSWIESVMFFTGYRKGEPLEVLLDRITLYKISFKGKSDFVEKPMPEIAFKGILDKFLDQKLVFVIMDPFGGKMEEISEDEIAFPHRKGNLYNIQYLVKWGENRERAASIRWIRTLHDFMRPYVSSSPRAAYVNYRDLDLGINQHQNTSYSHAAIWGIKYFKGNFKRLAKVKGQVDPGNYFRNEQSIPPHGF